MANKLYTVTTMFSVIDRMTSPISMMTKRTNSFTQSLNNMNRVSRDSFFKLGIAITAATGAMGIMLKKSADIETAVIKISTKLNGSMEQSTALVRELQSLAANTPLTTMPVLDAADLLLAQGIKPMNIMKTITQLGDISQGKDELFSSLVRGYSRIYSEDRITREHLDRFVFGGVPMYEALAKSMGLSIGVMSKEIERGNLGKDDLLIAIEALTSETGAYNRAMERQMQTLNGAMQQSRGWFSLALSSIGNIFNPFAKGMFQQSSDYFENIRNAFDKINKKTYGATTYTQRLDDKGNAVFDSKGQPIMDARREEFNTVIFDKIYEKLGRLREAFVGLIPNVDMIVANLENGSSFFYTFMDALIAIVEVVKHIAPIFKGFIGIIAALPQPILNFMAQGIIGLMVLVMVVSTLSNVFGAFIKIFGLFTKVFLFLKSISIMQILFGGLKKSIPIIVRVIDFAAAVIVSVIKKAFLFTAKIFGTIVLVVKKGFLLIAKAIGVSGAVIIGITLGIMAAFHILYQNWQWFREKGNAFIAVWQKTMRFVKDMPVIGKSTYDFMYNFITGIKAIFTGDIPTLLLLMVKVIVENLLMIPRLVVRGLSEMAGAVGFGWGEEKLLSFDKVMELPSAWLEKAIEDRAQIKEMNNEIENQEKNNLEININNNTEGKAKVDISNDSIFDSPNFQMGFNPLGNNRFDPMPTN